MTSPDIRWKQRFDNFIRAFGSLESAVSLSKSRPLSDLGSRDAMREAFNRGLIIHGDDWMDMIRSRNLSMHTYNKNIADEIVSKITGNYFDRFVELRTKFSSFG